MTYDVSIIAVNHNGSKYLPDFFSALSALESNDLAYELVFVDNASRDGSPNMVRESYGQHVKNLKLIESSKNLGFAGGNNLGAEHSTGEYLAFLNIDTAVDPGWLLNLWHCIRHSGAGIVNSKLLFFNDYLRLTILCDEAMKIANHVIVNDNPIRIESKFWRGGIERQGEDLVCSQGSSVYLPVTHGLTDCVIEVFPASVPSKSTGSLLICGREYVWAPNSLSSGCVIELTIAEVSTHAVQLIQNAGSGVNGNLDGYDVGFGEEDSGQYEACREINNACGAAMIMRKDDFDRCGRFDSSFFMYYEDTDLSYRVKNLGKRLLYCPKAVVRHVHAGTSIEWSPLFVYFVFRNKMLFILKHYSLKLFLRFFIKHARFTIQHLLSSVELAKKYAMLKALLSVCALTPIYVSRNVRAGRKPLADIDDLFDDPAAGP